MVHLDLGISLSYDLELPGADFIFNLQCAHTARQKVLSETLKINQKVQQSTFTEAATHTRYLRLKADPGLLAIHYQATVELDHYIVNPATLREIPIAQLPPEVFTYLYPSRYCQSDRLVSLSMLEFGHLPQGYSRVEAIQTWVRQKVAYLHNSSNSLTSAIDTLNDGVGVCRDFAHLMIAFCRALNIPARFTSGVDFGANSVTGALDFHAYVEVYLSHAWFIFDPSGNAIPMGFIRIGSGRDAADVSFAMIFGEVSSVAPQITLQASVSKSSGWVAPVLTQKAISTDSGSH